MQSKENTVPLASLPLEPISLRDYFAGQALPTIIAVCAGDTSITARPSTEAYFAEKAYLLADAMLAARTGGA